MLFAFFCESDDSLFCESPHLFLNLPPVLMGLALVLGSIFFIEWYRGRLHRPVAITLVVILALLAFYWIDNSTTGLIY